MTDEEKRDVARDEFDNCCCNYAIDLHEKLDALTKDLDVATRESDEVIKILGALAPGGSIVNMAIAAHTAIGSLKEQRDAAKAEADRLEKLVASADFSGGSMIWTSDHEKILERELTQLRAALDKATGPVSDWWFKKARPIINAIGEISVQEAMDGIERGLK